MLKAVDFGFMKSWPILDLLRDAVHQWNEDKAPRLGAALAYYSIFSLTPLLIIVMGLAALVYGAQAARGQVVRELESMVGNQAAAAIEELLKGTHDSGSDTAATIMGFVVLLLGASGVFLQLQDALNTIFKATPAPGIGILGMIRGRFLAFTAVLATGFVLLLSLFTSTALAAFNRFLTSTSIPGSLLVWQLVNNAVAFAVITLVFAMLYKLLPDTAPHWREVWGGAALASFLFTLGKHLLGIYLARTGTASVFGAAGSLVVLMIWVYYSAQVFLFGAEFVQVQRGRWTGPRTSLPDRQQQPAESLT